MKSRILVVAFDEIRCDGCMRISPFWSSHGALSQRVGCVGCIMGKVVRRGGFRGFGRGWKRPRDRLKKLSICLWPLGAIQSFGRREHIILPGKENTLLSTLHYPVRSYNLHIFEFAKLCRGKGTCQDMCTGKTVSCSAQKLCWEHTQWLS